MLSANHIYNYFIVIEYTNHIYSYFIVSEYTKRMVYNSDSSFAWIFQGKISVLHL